MQNDDPVAPVAPEDRIAALDVLRGIAVCAILAVNIVVMGTVGSTQGRTFPMAWNPDWITWALQRLLIEGPARGLFTLLFGAGMLLMLRRAEGQNPQVTPIDAWARRCLALLLFGLVHFAIFMWPGEILWTYGIAGLALLAFRTARPRTLLIWAALIMLGLSAFRTQDTLARVTVYQHGRAAEAAQAAGRPLTPAQEAGLEAVRGARASIYPTSETQAAEIEKRTNLGTLLSWSASGWVDRHLGNYSWWGVAESLGFMLVGMALFRSGILTGGASNRTYKLLVLVGCGLGLAVRLADLAWQARTGFELDLQRLSYLASGLRSALYEPARVSLALGYVGFIILLLRSGFLGAAGPLRALGRMALTVYSLQSILTSVLFYGFGYVGAFGFASLMLITAAIWLISCVLCIWWLRHFPIGPAEWALRAIAYAGFASRRRLDAPGRSIRSDAHTPDC